ncbi:napor protein short isoform [Salpingoeca rosetta]|uniref:Napor protein short isoform n=1 Tax=Salpingoeca rosetta (strain ATCC 50818 / BSB-021) TaxID=946362 RepID=F2TW53_SALR5|nr:napor protein short isoform [Salpingoeca rosetta]EGD72299.1 napor protein short isoform [Salpingoeca rosetta]|eukprot:XP_004998869.1 napor protein short isoform [Salpingoeca rosetta]
MTDAAPPVTTPATMPPPKDEDAIKLFVGQLPKSYGEEQLTALLQPYGAIHDMMILKNKMTGESRGCAFVTFCSRQSALSAIADLHEKRTLPTMANPMQVKIADSEQRGDDRKLFVGMISKTCTEADLEAMFRPFGEIESVNVLIGPEGQSKGCAFVKYTNAGSANQAIAKLHNSTTMEGCRAPMVVKIADTEKQKQQRRMQRQMPPMGMYGFPPNAMFGAQDMAQAMYGVQQFNVDAEWYPGAGFGQQPYAQAPYGGAARAPQKEGPPNSNLFIYHLPQELNDHSLAATFMSFGNVISSKVFVDKYTGQSKCFGFVSYDNPQSAQAAIQAMNGFQIGGKRLKVQLKRPKNAPY